MKKTICLFTSLLMAASMLTSCSESNEPSESSPGDSTITNQTTKGDPIMIVEDENIKKSTITSTDDGKGNYTNPVIFADVPDIDFIRVDDAYYMVSTTMHLSPGCPIMKS